MKKDSVVLEELDKGEVNYDNRCKIILSHPVIFAYFIKHCFADFVNVDFNEIVKACEKYLLITGKEDNLISGSKVIYDVYAHLNLPNNEGKMVKALFNGEHQNKANPPQVKLKFFYFL